MLAHLDVVDQAADAAQPGLVGVAPDVDRGRVWDLVRGDAIKAAAVELLPQLRARKDEPALVVAARRFASEFAHHAWPKSARSSLLKHPRACLSIARCQGRGST